MDFLVALCSLLTGSQKSHLSNSIREFVMKATFALIVETTYTIQKNGELSFLVAYDVPF